MPTFESGAERRIRLRQFEAKTAPPEKRAADALGKHSEAVVAHEAQVARELTETEDERKQSEIREALKVLERDEQRERTKRKVARARLHQALEGEEAAREHRLAEDLPGPDAINAITDEEARMHAYEQTFGITESSESPKREIPQIVADAMPSFEKGIKRPVAEAHFQQKVEKTKQILGQEKASAIWEEVMPLLGRDGDAATRYVFEFATIAQDAATKDAVELKGDIEALNEKYDLPSTYNPLRAERSKWKKPPFPAQPRRPLPAGPQIATPQNIERWREQMVDLNEELHREVADLRAQGLTDKTRARVETVSQQIQRIEAELGKIAEYKDLGADLMGEAVSYDLRLKELAQRMNLLSDQIHHTYGKTPEELRSLGGAGMLVARVRNWLAKISGKPPLLGEWEQAHEEHERLAELLEDYRGTYRVSAGAKPFVRLPSRKERERDEALAEIAPVTPDVVGMTEAEYEKRMDESAVSEQALEASEPPVEQRVEPLEEQRVEPPENAGEPIPVKARPRVLEVEQIRKPQAPETEYRAQKIRRPERQEIEALAQSLSAWKQQTDQKGKAFFAEMLDNIRKAANAKTWNVARAFIEKRGYQGWQPKNFKDALALFEATDLMDAELKRGLGEIPLRDRVESDLQDRIRTLRAIQREDPEDFNEYLKELEDCIAVFRKGGDITKTTFGKEHIQGKAFQWWKVGDFERLRDSIAPTKPRADRKRATRAPRFPATGTR